MTQYRISLYVIDVFQLHGWLEFDVDDVYDGHGDGRGEMRGSMAGNYDTMRKST